MRTLPSLVKAAGQALGGNEIIHHERSENNPLGVSGIHTFILDIMEIYASTPDDHEKFRRMEDYLLDGSVKLNEASQDD